jgi:hypothetical protein
LKDARLARDAAHGTDERGQREWRAMLQRIKMRNLGLEGTLVKRSFAA